VAGDSVGGEFERRVMQMRNVLFLRRSDGAVVRIATPLINSDNIDEAKRRLTMFAADLYPRLRGVLPL
jgi:hypothetical protein